MLKFVTTLTGPKVGLAAAVCKHIAASLAHHQAPKPNPADTQAAKFFCAYLRECQSRILAAIDSYELHCSTFENNQPNAIKLTVDVQYESTQADEGMSKLTFSMSMHRAWLALEP
jgi:hypothetical protein